VPVTPFHGGIGLALKATTGRRFSFLLFCCTQVAIDLESLTHVLRGDWPIHRFFHTFIGAAILSTGVVFALRPAVAAVLRRVARLPDLGRWVDAAEIPWQAAVATAIAGCLGHVIPDAIMHADVEPFAPFTSDNPFLDLVPVAALHVGLIVLGALGAGAMLARHRRSRA